MSPTRSTCRESRTTPDRVLVVSDRDDVHARAVIHRLDRIAGIDGLGLLFDTATFPLATNISAGDLQSAIDVFPPLPKVYGRDTPALIRTSRSGVAPRLPLAGIRAIYWRRPRACLIDDALEAQDLRRYAAHSSRETVEGLIEQFALAGRVVDPPSRVSRASLKVLQLALARRLNLRPPQTLVTNDPDQARAFVKELRQRGVGVISKSPADLPDVWARTEPIGEAAEEMLDRLRLAPAVLQEHIDGGPDLRIIVVGRRLFAVAIRADPGCGPDSRSDPAPAITAVEVPSALHRRILALQRALGLSFGAYDFKCDAGGTPYFLEVNPSGQWLGVELAGRHPIAESLARLAWLGEGAEWETTLEPLEESQLDLLFPTEVREEQPSTDPTFGPVTGRFSTSAAGV